MTKSDFKVFTNLAASMDGKIATKERGHIDPSKHDRRLMDLNRARAHAVLIGAGTLRVFKKPALVQSKSLQLWRKARRLNPQPINVVLARNVDFSASWPFFTDPRVERVIVVPESTPASQLKPFQPLAHILKYDKSNPFPDQIVDYLKKLGCKNLLIEGGGGVLFPWVERDMIDEWNLTLVPKVFGGETAPTMVEGEGFDVSRIKNYKLRKVRRWGNEVFLRYTRA